MLRFVDLLVCVVFTWFSPVLKFIGFQGMLSFMDLFFWVRFHAGICSNSPVLLVLLGRLHTLFCERPLISKITIQKHLTNSAALLSF